MNLAGFERKLYIQLQNQFIFFLVLEHNSKINFAEYPRLIDDYQQTKQRKKISPRYYAVYIKQLGLNFSARSFSFFRRDSLNTILSFKNLKSILYDHILSKYRSHFNVQSIGMISSLQYNAHCGNYMNRTRDLQSYFFPHSIDNIVEMNSHKNLMSKPMYGQARGSAHEPSTTSAQIGTPYAH